MSFDSAEFNESIQTYVRHRLTTLCGLTPEGTRPSLEARIAEMATQARTGCGQSYELFLQQFSGMVDAAYPTGSLDRDQAVAIAILVGGYATRAEREQTQHEMAEAGYCCHGLDPYCCPCGCGDLD